MMQAFASQQPFVQAGSNDLFDDSSRHSMSSFSRRLSKGSSSHRTGNSMRVVKPSSASNSPQALWNTRRRTMMHDSATSRRTQQVLEQLLTPEQAGQNQQTRRSERPVSWHPGSFIQQALPSNFMPTAQHVQQQAISTQGYFADRQQTSPHYSHMSPGMMASSANTSPASTFSPLPMQYPGFGATSSQYLASEGWQPVQKSAPFYSTPNEPRDCTEPFPIFGADLQLCAQSTESADWQNYIMHGMNTTTPPTPDSLMQPEPALPAMPQESPAFQTLDEPEDEGEVLVGMGLYDAPEKLNEDPQLDNYRSTVCSLLGSRFRSSEPQGKGLKLEETWSPPPKSDDGEDEEDAEDDEAEATTEATKTEA